MPKYEVTVCDLFVASTRVEAEDEHEAYHKVADMMGSSQLERESLHEHNYTVDEVGEADREGPDSS